MKSARLKTLIDDLFEVSKASTNNIAIELGKIDYVKFVRQYQVESEDRLKDSGVDFRFDLPAEELPVFLDGQRTYRIFENLTINAAKYSAPGSRVYVKVERCGEFVKTTMKNVSASELNFDPDEITERFIRGDLSRNTEGSGLGLAIAKSFTELQGGSFRIEIDGDLFKAIILWPLSETCE
jgi:signal transduction histidine kinase